MMFLEAVVLCVALVLATVYVHYEGLSLISRLVSRVSHGRTRVFYVVLGTLSAHFIEIFLYALGYLAAESLGVGTISDPPVGSFRGLFYFSVETFTSLGFGDRHPTSDLRLLAGIECLNGFILIGWSTSFTYLSMRDFWDGHHT
jgi:hypothetical protein